MTFHYAPTHAVTTFKYFVRMALDNCVQRSATVHVFALTHSREEEIGVPSIENRLQEVHVVV